MIEPYWGEFLISPIPLELSLNFCSHKCFYCFANLNEPKRTGNTKAVMSLLTNYMKRDTLEAFLLREGYPVVVSNRSDPFSQTNYRQFLPILETMTSLEIPVCIQTKGGVGVDDVLGHLPPSVWYISISFYNDELRERIEPGAPSIGERLDLIEKVSALGHKVILGLNPCVPEWLPGTDLQDLVKSAKAAGALGAWIEELHLHNKQVGNMTPKEISAMTQDAPDLIERAKKRQRGGVDNDFFFLARSTCKDAGMEVFSNGQPTQSNIWDIYRSVYPKTFPTNQDFINYCYDQDFHGKVIPFDVWYSIVGESLPKGTFRMSKYIGASSVSLWEDYDIPSKLSYDSLLSIAWLLYRVKFSPSRLPAFAFAALKTQNGWKQLIDERGLPFVVFNKEGDFTEYFTEVVLEWEVEENG